MPACYEEARKAINVAKSFHVVGRIVHFDDFGIYRILYSTKHDEMTKFAADYYTPLASYDAENNTQLLDTIEKYFECNGNISKVAKALYTHYNTIVYRIERISKITGMDLDDPEHRLNLQMALKVGKILEKNSF
jgi:purine catabolism regulator